MIYLLFLSYLLNTMLHTEIHPVKIGETEVKIIKQEGIHAEGKFRMDLRLHGENNEQNALLLRSRQDKNFVHLHENEQTALFAAKYYIDHQGGSLVTLNHSGTRNIRFNLKGQIFEFDPNRIFTRDGIRKTLIAQGHYSEEAEKAVLLFAKQLLNYLPKGKVISVHNNVDYSIKSYFPGESFFNDADAIYTRTNTNHRNFYFVTQKMDYERLVKQHFNVALQSATATDDGSLSYYLAHQPYINVEAAFNETYLQFLMLEAA